MYFKQKIAYMAIGCLFTLAGYFLATLGIEGITPHNASAQAGDEQVIDEIVLCRKLMIVNAEGKPVAVLGDRNEGGGALSIYNKAGKLVAKLDSTDGNGMVSILNKKGQPAGSMGVDDRGNGVMAVLNGAGKFVARMEVSKDGDGGLSIIITDRNGNGSLVITNKEGKAVAGLAVTDKGGKLGTFYEGKWKYY